MSFVSQGRQRFLSLLLTIYLPFIMLNTVNTYKTHWNHPAQNSLSFSSFKTSTNQAIASQNFSLLPVYSFVLHQIYVFMCIKMLYICAHTY